MCVVAVMEPVPPVPSMSTFPSTSVSQSPSGLQEYVHGDYLARSPAKSSTDTRQSAATSLSSLSPANPPPAAVSNLPMLSTFILLNTVMFNDNDNDKRLGLTAKADQPDHKKYNTPKIKMDNEAVQKLHTS